MQLSKSIQNVISSLTSDIKKRFEYLKEPEFLQATLIDPCTKSYLPDSLYGEKQAFTASVC